MEEEKILEKDKILQLFANISSLHQFHNTHLLPALMENSRDWHTTHRFSTPSYSSIFFSVRSLKEYVR